MFCKFGLAFEELINTNIDMHRNILFNVKYECYTKLSQAPQSSV